MEPDVDGGARFTPQLLMGLIIVAIGALFTLDNLGLVDAYRYLRYWPAALILIGAVKVWQSPGGGGAFGNSSDLSGKTSSRDTERSVVGASEVRILLDIRGLARVLLRGSGNRR